MAITQRNNLIDMLRFVAAISVAVFHFYSNVEIKINNWYTNIFNYGYLGVPMFFIISGYCILIALKHSKTPLNFIIRRFFRIFPPYWFSLIVTGSIILIFKLIKGTNSISTLPKSITEIIATISLLTEPITNVKTINWVYWTLTYELFFYVVIYICSHFKAKYFTIALICVNIVSCLLPVSDRGILTYFKYWPLFCLGASLYKVLHNNKDGQVLNFTLFASSLIGYYYTGQEFLNIVVSGVTVLLITADYFRPLAENKFTLLGDFSYSIYLIHIPIGVYCFGALRDTHLLRGNDVLNFILDMLLLGLIICLSRLIYKYIEVPSVNYGKQLTAKPNVSKV